MDNSRQDNISSENFIYISTKTQPSLKNKGSIISQLSYFTTKTYVMGTHRNNYLNGMMIHMKCQVLILRKIRKDFIK